MAPNPDYVYCTICGMALGSDAIVLAGPHWPRSNTTSESLSVIDEQVIRYTAEVDSFPGKILLLPSREQIYPQYAYQHESDIAPAKMYLGIHAACEEIANRVMKTSFNAKVRSISDLWLTLERRCASYLSQGRRQRRLPRDMNYVPPIPNNQSGQPLSLGFDRYYVPYHCLDQWGDEWEGWWDEEPINIPNLTTQLMLNLEQISDASSKPAESSIKASQKEIDDHVCTFFHEDQVTLECSYDLPQSIWKQIFFQIPFLWDLDIKAVHDKTGLHDADKWNWEKLTRQVTSSPHPLPSNAASYRDEDAWDYKDVGLDVPGGFTNRRRVWQILEDMYANDVQG
ncbi:hypothetical protein F53441_13375 [Fusarium austroafricanum]|uniref:Uncharacterized protein n=1 Tax=Fusarium austroafricanum TaxID=2364996 RepID=A0A8H4NRG7_9HYPO|nr:hypothetical protein F53441_13375 [Fusarium austroafricanum]